MKNKYTYKSTLSIINCLHKKGEKREGVGGHLKTAFPRLNKVNQKNTSQISTYLINVKYANFIHLFSK